MSSANSELLQHILEKINFILSHTNGKSAENVSNDPVLSRAVIRSLEIIGEASRKIGPDFKTEHPEIEWKKMGGTRDRLIHDYMGVDYEIVWNIITAKLPVLRRQIEAILSHP